MFFTWFKLYFEQKNSCHMAVGTVNRFTRKEPYQQLMETRCHMGREEDMKNAIRDFLGEAHQLLWSCWENCIEKLHRENWFVGSPTSWIPCTIKCRRQWRKQFYSISSLKITWVTLHPLNKERFRHDEAILVAAFCTKKYSYTRSTQLCNMQ